MHRTLVVRKNSRTSSVALPFYRSLTERGRGCPHSHAFPISFHNALRCGAHARRLVKVVPRLGPPLVHDQHSSVSVIRWMPQEELVVATGEVILTRLSCGHRRTRPGGGLYRRSGFTCSEIHSAVS